MNSWRSSGKGISFAIDMTEMRINKNNSLAFVAFVELASYVAAVACAALVIEPKNIDD